MVSPRAVVLCLVAALAVRTASSLTYRPPGADARETEQATPPFHWWQPSERSIAVNATLVVASGGDGGALPFGCEALPAGVAEGALLLAWMDGGCSFETKARVAKVRRGLPYLSRGGT